MLYMWPHGCQFEGSTFRATYEGLEKKQFREQFSLADLPRHSSLLLVPLVSAVHTPVVLYVRLRGLLGCDQSVTPADCTAAPTPHLAGACTGLQLQRLSQYHLPPADHCPNPV